MRDRCGIMPGEPPLDVLALLCYDRRQFENAVSPSSPEHRTTAAGAASHAFGYDQEG